MLLGVWFRISLSQFVSVERGVRADRVESISPRPAVPVTVIEVASRRIGLIVGENPSGAPVRLRVRLKATCSGLEARNRVAQGQSSEENGLGDAPVPRLDFPPLSDRFDWTRCDLNHGDWHSGAGRDKFDTIRSYTNTVRHKICSPLINCYNHGFPGSIHLPVKRSQSLGPSKLSKESRLWKHNLLVCLTKLLHLSCP